MSTQFIEILDTALEQLRKNDSIPTILEQYPDQAEHLASLLHAAETLNSIQPVEMPSFDAMQSDRIEFLANIEQIETPSVSPGLLVRIKGWMGSIIPKPYTRKEKQNMSTLFARAVLVITLLFGATGGAYAMADNSLPNGPMYGAKLAMERVQLRMKSDPADIAGQHLELARNRAREMTLLAQAGSVPDKGLMTRLENHLNTAFQLAAQLGSDGEMQGVLLQAQTMLQEQTQAMTQTQARVTGSANEALQMAIQLMTRARNQVEAGLQDQNAFRLRFRYGAQLEQPGPGQPGGYNPDCPNCPCEGCEPVGDGNKYVQNEEGAPGQPGGNPDCPSDDCIPAGDEHKYGQSEEGAPGQPGGNPDCPLDDCIPVGDEHKYGQSEEGAPGQPGGNPDCTCEDCVPEGDENNYGPQPEQPGPGGPGGNPDCPNCPCDDCVPEPEGDQNQNRNH